jgi:hypothetical protein
MKLINSTVKTFQTSSYFFSFFLGFFSAGFFAYQNLRDKEKAELMMS